MSSLKIVEVVDRNTFVVYANLFNIWGNKKVVKVTKKVIKNLESLLKLPPNPLKRLVGAQGLEPWTRCLKGSCLPL